MEQSLYLNRTKIGDMCDSVTYSSGINTISQIEKTSSIGVDPSYAVENFINDSEGMATFSAECKVDDTGTWGAMLVGLLALSDSFLGKKGVLETYNGTWQTIHSFVTVSNISLAVFHSPYYKFKITFKAGIDMNSNLLSNGDCQIMNSSDSALLNYNSLLPIITTSQSEFGGGKLVGQVTSSKDIYYNLAADITLTAGAIYKLSIDVYYTKSTAIQASQQLLFGFMEGGFSGVGITFNVVTNEMMTLLFDYKADGNEDTIELSVQTDPILFNNLRLELV